MATNGFFVESLKGDVTHHHFAPSASGFRQFTRLSSRSPRWTSRDIRLAPTGETRGLVVFPALDGNRLEMVALLQNTMPFSARILRPAAQFRFDSWSRKQAPDLPNMEGVAFRAWPAVVQGAFGPAGNNTHLLIPLNNGIAHYVRRNDEDAPKNAAGSPLWNEPFFFARDLQVNAVGLLHRAPGAPLEAIAIVEREFLFLFTGVERDTLSPIDWTSVAPQRIPRPRDVGRGELVLPASSLTSPLACSYYEGTDDRGDSFVGIWLVVGTTNGFSGPALMEIKSRFNPNTLEHRFQEWQPIVRPIVSGWDTLVWPGNVDALSCLQSTTTVTSLGEPERRNYIAICENYRAVLLTYGRTIVPGDRIEPAWWRDEIGLF